MSVVACDICQQEIEGAKTTDLLYQSMCDLAAVQHFHPGVCHDQALAWQGAGQLPSEGAAQLSAHQIRLLRIRLLASAFTLFLAFLLAVCGGNGNDQRIAWINGIVECPSSPEFGEQVASSANLWDDLTMRRSLTEIPHGAQAQLLGEARSGFHEVRYGTQRGFVQTILISDYDPAGGVQPNASEC